MLWTQSAKQLADMGYLIKAGLQYDYEQVKQYISLPENYIDLRNRILPLSRAQRIIQKLRIRKFSPRDILHQFFRQSRPDLVIISQGNNIEGRHFIKDCIQFNIPFVTITQLVALEFWPGLYNALIDDLRLMYKQAKRNFFVSKNTLSLHEKLLGEKLDNSTIVYNPFTKAFPFNMSFPVLENGIYKVALVGRVEAFHKGYDLLIEVLANDKWRNRPIHFSLFGNGPHVELLKRLIQQNNITNLSLHDHVEDVAVIWKQHHILMMPSRMEGQSLSLIEAMRFKRAAIVTNVGGTNELVEEGLNGFIAEFPIPAFIDAALERAWEKRNEWEQLGINASRIIAQKHPVDAVSFFNQQIQAIIAG